MFKVFFILIFFFNLFVWLPGYQKTMTNTFRDGVAHHLVSVIRNATRSLKLVLVQKVLALISNGNNAHNLILGLCLYLVFYLTKVLLKTWHISHVTSFKASDGIVQ